MKVTNCTNNSYGMESIQKCSTTGWT